MSILFPYFELLASLFVLLLAFDIYSRHYENQAARFYVRFALLAFFACILTYSLRIAFTLELAGLINRFSASLIAFAFAVYAHFALIFSKKDNFLKNKAALIALYAPPTIVAALFMFTNLMYQRFEILSYGIISIPAPTYILFVIQTLSYTGLGIFLFATYSLTAAQKTERQQARLIAIGSVIPVLLGILSDQILPLILNTRVTFPTVVFDFAIMNLFIFYAMRRYSLFAISPGLAANTIIETMPDSLIVTDLDGRVVLLNEEAHKYFHCPKGKILGKHIQTLFEQKDHYEKLYQQVADQGLEIERFKANLCDPLGQCLPSFINANILRDELGSRLGVIFVIRDIRG
ncbi:MAG: PAS domain-containing protein [Candidatus Margulisbacteria bacterium]|nr:PAS domain-containing protein [Candidatus Margulisiibacteriota bacterium]